MRVKRILRKTAVPAEDLQVLESAKRLVEVLVARASLSALEEAEGVEVSVSEDTRTLQPRKPLDEEL